jgi:predicted dehydrogenase
MVGYNRRFYSSVQFVKSNLSDLTEIHSSWVISELSTYHESTINEKSKTLRENSVHIFDLLLYLFGSVKNISVEKSSNTSKLICISALAKFNSGATANLNISFNIPNLYEAKIFLPQRVLNLKPIENLYEFSKISVREPINQNGTREYAVDGPVWKMDEVDSQFKPGFYRQYEALQEMIFGIPSKVGASLRDAKASLQFAEILFDEKYGKSCDLI